MQTSFAIILQAAQLAGSACVASLWQGALLAATVWLCLRLAPRATAALRFTLWAAVLSLVALLPVVEVEIASRHPVHDSILQLDIRWSLFLAALWLAVSLARAASLARQTRRLCTLHRQATPVPQPAAIQTLLTAGRRPVQLCTSNQVDRPGVIGFFAPRILIPAWLYPELTVPELEQIVLHEIEHLRRRDDWLNLLQKFALVVFPLNPILIAVERLLCRERELACDDGVLRRTRTPRLYATCLTTLAERGLDHRAFSLALGALGDPERRSELGRRIQCILHRQSTASPRYARALTAAVGFALTVSAVGLARCPQLVAFGPATLTVATATPAAIRVPNQPLRAVYTDAATTAPRLLRSSLALKHRTHTASIHRQKPTPPSPARDRQPKIASARSRSIFDSDSEAALLLTSFPEQDQPRLLTLDQALPVPAHFAVVRVAGGWLLVQL